MSPIHQAPTALSYWLVGVDVGGTTVSTVLLDEDLQSHGELTVATDLTSPDATMLGIVAAIEQTLALDDSPRKLAAIGLGIPGQQDQAQGIVRIAVNLHWYDYPLVARLVEHFGAPCVIENDVRVATLGVYRFDNPAGEQDLAYISIGTGLATGVILEGKLLRGRHGLAGEFGTSSLTRMGHFATAARTVVWRRWFRPRLSCAGRGKRLRRVQMARWRH